MSNQAKLSKEQEATPKHMRWACPLGCEAGFITIPQTNEHLKKSHMWEKKSDRGPQQVLISPEEMEKVRDVTRRNRLKDDIVKMREIHLVFSKNSKVPPEDLQLHAPTRDEIRRMADACAKSTYSCNATALVLETFRRLLVKQNVRFANMSSDAQNDTMAIACSMIPAFVEALGITGQLPPDGNEPALCTMTDTHRHHATFTSPPIINNTNSGFQDADTSYKLRRAHTWAPTQTLAPPLQLPWTDIPVSITSIDPGLMDPRNISTSGSSNSQLRAHYEGSQNRLAGNEAINNSEGNPPMGDSSDYKEASDDIGTDLAGFLQPMIEKHKDMNLYHRR